MVVQLFRTVCRGSVLAGFLLILLGCGERGAANRPFAVVPASGVVTLQGQPVHEATVTFHPLDAGGDPLGGGKPSGRAITDAQGHFRLWTYDRDDGVVPGEHVVTIVKTKIQAPDVDSDVEGFDAATAPPPPPPQHLVPERYNSQATSDLRANVTTEGANAFVFNLD